eukprot:7380696-Prymnesium_polylepis.3
MDDGEDDENDAPLPIDQHGKALPARWTAPQPNKGMRTMHSHPRSYENTNFVSSHPHNGMPAANTPNAIMMYSVFWQKLVCKLQSSEPQSLIKSSDRLRKCAEMPEKVLGHSTVGIASVIEPCTCHVDGISKRHA